MKKVLGIGLLLCLLLPLLTTYTWLHVEKRRVRREIKWRMIAGLEKEELCLLRFSVSNAQKVLRWEHSKEFEYAGKMYDIVEREERGDSVFYLCWPDDKETALNKKLDNILHLALQQSPKHRDGKSRVNKFFDSLYCSPGITNYCVPDQRSTAPLKELPEPFYSSPTQSPPAPPPKVC